MVTVRIGKRKFNFGMVVVDGLSLGIVGPEYCDVPVNLLDRQFAAERPDQKWIADFTYVWTAGGLALCGGCHRSVLAAGGRLVDERAA